MVRKAILMAVATLLALTGVASARPDVPATFAALQGSEGTDDVVASTPPPQLILGERFTSDLFEMEVQDAFSVDSPLYPGYDEVRMSVALRHRADWSWLASPHAFSGDHNFPRLQLVDGAGVVHDVPTNVLPLWVEVEDESGESTTMVQLGDFSYQVAGFSLSYLPQGIPARWTVGFRVPSASNSDLVVQATFAGEVLAEWDLESNPVRSAGWDRPEGFDFAQLGDSIAWGESLLIEPKAVKTAVCADPQFGHVSVDASMLLEVESIDDADALWPNVNYPEMVAIAVWDDGTTARYSQGSAAFYDDETDDEVFDHTLLRFGEHVVVPPRTAVDRFMEFIAPRDSRFADVSDGPSAVVLYPPDGAAVWVDLNSTPSGSISDFECEIPTWALFAVDRQGTAPEPPAPVLAPETVFDA